MKSALFIFTFFLSLNLSAQERCLNHNHIFLIHGVGGSPKSFGQMENYLKRLDECYEVRSFEYDTGNSSLSTYDFAGSFHEYLLSHKEITSSDKISLIMHSQGGLVGNIWLNNIRQTHPMIYQQIDAFITLSTPHWGAEMANIGKHLFYSLPEGVKNPISPFGRIELNEMSYGSATIKHLNSIWMQNFRPLNFRPLALGGIHKVNNKIIGENDIVVPAFSSRPDHYFAETEINVNVNSGTLPVSLFTKTNRIPYVTVAANHLKIDLPGIATIPEECLKGCNHPSLPYITEHLKGRSIASTNEKLDHFRSSIYLRNISGEKIDKKDVDIDVLSSANITIPVSQRLKQFKGEARLNDGIAFSFHGNTKNVGTQTLRVRLQIKHKLERIIEMPVEGGYTSLIQITVK